MQGNPDSGIRKDLLSVESGILGFDSRNIAKGI